MEQRIPASGTKSVANTVQSDAVVVTGIYSNRICVYGSVTTDTFSILVSVDGTNYSAAVKPIIDVTTGALASGTTLASGTYYVDGVFKGFKINKNGTANAATFSYATF